MSKQENSVSPGLADFRVDRKVGSGGFSKVFAVKPASARVMDKLSRHGGSLRRNGGYLAMKQIDKLVACRSESDYLATSRENQFLQQLRGSPFCQQFVCSFQTPSHLYMVSEYCSGGSLFDFLKFLRDHRRAMRGPPFVYLAAELISGLQFIHGKGIIHRDLKPENVLLTGEGHVVIADFGLAFHKKDAAFEAEREAGTPIYRAPETFWIGGPPHCSEMADWWSLGVILLIALTQKNPLQRLVIKEGDSQRRRLLKLKELQQANYLSATCHGSGVSGSVPAMFVKGLLHADPRQRLGAVHGAEEVKRHDLFSALLATPAHWRKLDKHQLPPPVLPSRLWRNPKQDVPCFSPPRVETASNAPDFVRFDRELFQDFTVPPSPLSDDEEDGELSSDEEDSGE